MKFSISQFITNILLLSILIVLVFDFKMEVSLTPKVDSAILSTENGEFSYVNQGSVESVNHSEVEPITSNEEVTDLLDKRLQSRLEELKAKAEVSKITVQPENKLESISNIVTKNDESCYVKFDNFSQPKFAFNKDCEPLTKAQTEKKRALTLNKLPDSYTVTFKAENESDVVYVYTDYTCPYCRKLHKNIERFNSIGITVKYILYPRAIGYGPQYREQAEVIVENMTNAWCAPDQNAAFHELYTKKIVGEYICAKTEGRIPAPIREHYALGQMLDLEHTPAIVSSRGKLAYGFTNVSKTLSDLGI